jgi:hypothetical protein
MLTGDFDWDAAEPGAGAAWPEIVLAKKTIMTGDRTFKSGKARTAFSIKVTNAIPSRPESRIVHQ